MGVRRKVHHSLRPYEIVRKYKEDVAALEKRLGRVPMDEEIQAETGMDPKEMRMFTIDDQEEQDLELLVKVSVSNNNLLKLRRALGLRQKDIEAQLGWPRRKYGSIETCRQYPSEQDMTELEQFFGKPREDLFPKWLKIFSERWKRMEKQKLVTIDHIALQSAETLALPTADDPIRDTEQTLIKNMIQEAMQKADLSARHKKILEMRFGMDGEGTKTLEEVGKEFDVTRSRIRDLEAQALEKMKPFIPEDFRGHISST